MVRGRTPSRRSDTSSVVDNDARRSVGQLSTSQRDFWPYLSVASGMIVPEGKQVGPTLNAVDMQYNQFLKSDLDGVQYTIPVSEKASTAKSDEPKGTYMVALVTMCMTTMGFGLLSLPKGFAKSGLVPGVILISVFGVLTDIGLCMIVQVATATKKKSLEDIAGYLYGDYGHKFVRWTLMICLFIAVVSAFTIFMETWGRSGDVSANETPGLLRQFAKCGPTQCNGLTKVTVGLVALVLIFPLLLQDSLHGLRHISALAAICLVAAIGIFTYQYASFVSTGEYKPIHDTVDPSGDALGLCSVVGIAFMAFFCHFNILPLFAELREPDKIYSIIHTAILGIALPVNIFIGMAGYFLFGTTVEGNVFDSMQSDLGKGAAFTVALVSLLKLPLIFKPFKDVMFSELGVDADRRMLRAVLTGVFALVAFLVAIFAPLDDISAIGGATTGAAVGFVFPGLLMFAKSWYTMQHNTTEVESDPEAPEQTPTSGEPSSGEPSASSSSETNGKADLRTDANNLKVVPGWKALPVERKNGAILGIAFCCVGVICGIVGLITAIMSIANEN